MSQADSGALDWRKSTRCESQHCLEVARFSDGLAIRNSTEPTRYLTFTRSVWRNFLESLSARD